MNRLLLEVSYQGSLRIADDTHPYATLVEENSKPPPIEVIISLSKAPRASLPEVAHLSKKINSLGLAFACMQATQQSSLPTLGLIAVGGFNAVFNATFPSGDQVIARCPLSTEDTSPESTVATMTYAKHVMHVPCPTVLAWNSKNSDDNIVGLPYIIMEKSPGTNLADCWDTMSTDEQVYVLFNIAKHYVHLTRRLPFKQFGRIYFDDARLEKALNDIESYTVGKFRPRLLDPFPGISRPLTYYALDPCERIQDLWQKAHDAMDKKMDDRFGYRASPEESPDSWNVEELQALVHAKITRRGDFIAISDDVLQIIQLFEIPTALAQPCLVPMDFAFRNIMYEEEEVTAFLDWDDIAVLPSVLIPHCPDELEPARYMSSSYIYHGPFLSPEPKDVLHELTEKLSELRWSQCIDYSRLAWMTENPIRKLRAQEWQQIFFQFLGLSARQNDNNPISGAGGKGEDISLATVTNNLAAHAQLCKDAYRINMLLQGDYMAWIKDREWITSKLTELKGKQRKWPLRLSGSSLW